MSCQLAEQCFPRLAHLEVLPHPPSPLENVLDGLLPPLPGAVGGGPKRGAEAEAVGLVRGEVAPHGQEAEAGKKGR